MRRKLLTALIAAVAVIILIIGFSGCYYEEPRSYQKDSGGLHYSRGMVVSCYDEEATEIVIPNSVTYYDYAGEEKTFKVTQISDNVFRGHKNLERVVIPETVERINPTAFAGCEKLKAIEIVHGNPVYHSAGNNIIETASKTLVAGCTASYIPSDGSVTRIGAQAFADFVCTGIAIPEAVTEICESAFAGSRLESVHLPDGLEVLGGKAFADSKLLSITLPAGLKVLGGDAFDGCEDLNGISVSENNEYFSGYDGIVYNKSRTEFVLIPDSLSGERTLPESLTEIPDFAFMGRERLNGIIIHDGVKSIGKGAFEGCLGLTSLTIPNSVESITEGALAKCAGLESLSLPFRIKDADFDRYYTNFGFIFGYNVDFDGAIKIVSDYNTFYVPEKFSSVTVTDGELGQSAFKNFVNLKSVTLGEKITTVGHETFYNCTALENIEMKSVETIGQLAFNGCTSLKTIVIPNTYKKGSGSSFYGCGTLEYITMPAIAIEMFGSLSTKKLTITGGVIPYYIFRDKSTLEEVVIGDDVTEIQNGAFSGCKNLKIVDLGNGVKEIGSFAFPAPNKYALEYTVYDNAYYLGNSQNPYYFLAEKTSKNITSCEIHPETRIIGSSAFNNCEKLADVVIPENVITIDYRAFYNCCGIERLVLPKGFEILGEGALCDCINLKYLFIPSTVERIEKYAIRDCNWRADIYYEGTKEKLDSICGEDNFTIYRTANFIKLHYYSETKPTEEGPFWHYVDGEITDWETD